MPDVYKVGVALALSSNHAQVLGALSKGLLGVQADVDKLTGGFNKLGAVIKGALGIYAADKMLGGIEKLVQAGSKIVHQQEMMRIAGMGNQEIAEATARAYAVSAQVQTTTIADNLKHIKELRYAFGDYNTAQTWLGQVSKAQSVLGVLGGKGAADQVWPMIKALEEKGLTTKPDEMMKYLNAMTQAAVSTGGRVTPEQFFQTILYGRQAAQGWDLSFIGGALPRLIQSMGGAGGGGRGGGPGNALMTMYQAVVSGNIGRQSAEVFQELGLLPKTGTNFEAGGHHLHAHFGPHGVSKSASGLTARFAPGSMKGSDLFLQNPYEWVQQILMPAVTQRLGITPGHELGEQERNKVQEYLSQAFKNRTGGSVVIQMGTQGRYLLGEQSPFEKDIKLQKGAYAIDQAFETLMRNDPVMRMQAFNAQWDSMMQAFGAAFVPTALRVMGRLTDVFTHLAQSAGAHPGVMEALTVGIAGLAAVLAGAGVGLIIAAFAAGGWVIPAITAVITFLTTLALMMKRVPLESLQPNQTAPNAFGNWTPAQKLAAGIQPISYRTGGDFGTGLHSGGGYTLMPGGGGVIPKGARIPALPSYGTNLGALTDGVGAGVGGSAFLKARRGRFAAAIHGNPQLHDEIAGMLLTEGAKDPVPVAESLLNRSDYAGKSLHQMLHSGFYGPINRGALPGAIARLHRNPSLMKKMDSAIESALNGSDLIKGATDQGLKSDPNGRWMGGYIDRGHGNIFNDWGGGPGGHAGARAYREFLQSHVNDSMHGKALRDHFGYRGRHDPEHPSGAIPHPQASSLETPIVMHMDGDVVARGTFRRAARSMNGPSHSSTLADFSRVRPVSI